jgi:hypothetical protein
MLSIAETVPFTRASAPTVEWVQAPILPAPASKAPAVRRRPPWRAPTRWMQPTPARSLAPFVLLAVIGIGALAVYEGWIDLERWREIIDAFR